jgi:N-6 DNA Methylase
MTASRKLALNGRDNREIAALLARLVTDNTAPQFDHLNDLVAEPIDWQQVSPLSLGSLLEAAMAPTQRRNLGAHYTSEKNILKVINSLFMDELRAEFHRLKGQPELLLQLQDRLAQLKFLDPACGCGNFLALAYRELRQLELAILQTLKQQGASLLNRNALTKVNLNQFYGLELAELPTQIAQIVMWLTDYQINWQVSQQLGIDFVKWPLAPSARIVSGDALTKNWSEIIAPTELNYILGNPPFIGYHLQSKAQKSAIRQLLGHLPSAGMLDYVAGWFYKTAEYMQENQAIRAAFLATNSITQGRQVAVLWKELLSMGVKIHFAHRTFQWADKLPDAAVHCVIIGFGLQEVAIKRLFYYDTPQSEAREQIVASISPNLRELVLPLLLPRSTPLCAVPTMTYGSKPVDGGHFLLSNKEKEALIAAEPLAQAVIRPFVGAKEFLTNQPRWCLWLVDADPELLKQLPLVQARVKQVQQMRQQSSKSATAKLAVWPTVFAENRQPQTDYLLLPLHFSYRRDYLPLGFLTANWIAGNSCATLAGATNYHFGVLSSGMHRAWVDAICGRLKSDTRYSVSLVYNNFPWPMSPSKQQQEAVAVAAQAVLAARAEFAATPLATLYDPMIMPAALLTAHQVLDRAVDRCYRRLPFVDEAARVAYLFQLYEQYHASLFPALQLSRRQNPHPVVKKMPT